MADFTVLVTGATGKQGGAVARLLHQHGHMVRAMTRRPESDAARELSALGIDVVRADMDEPASLATALEAVNAVFAMATPYEQGVDAELREGKNLADAAHAAGVEHYVYSSVASADRKTGIPHFESKMRIEEHIHALGLPFTIIRPVYFMENLFWPASMQALRSGILRMPLPPGRKLQQIDVAAVAQLSVMALEDRPRFLGQVLDIASDELDGDEAAAALTRASGLSIRYVQQPTNEVRAYSEDLALMYDWFDRVGYDADIAALKREYGAVSWRSFQTWASTFDWPTLLQLEARIAPSP